MLVSPDGFLNSAAALPCSKATAKLDPGRALHLVGQRANSPSKGRTGQEETFCLSLFHWGKEQIPLKAAGFPQKPHQRVLKSYGRRVGFDSVQTGAKKLNAEGDANPLCHS